jgi:hypothetical protein
MRDAVAEHARECATGGLSQCDHGQQRCADQEHLLQDQHEGCRHDVAGITADRVEDRLQQDFGVDFYSNHFVGKMPADTRIERISRTVGKDQVVDELILYFTHDCPIDYMLPGIPPTGRKVVLPHVVVMKMATRSLTNTSTGIRHACLLRSGYAPSSTRSEAWQRHLGCHVVEDYFDG